MIGAAKSAFSGVAVALVGTMLGAGLPASDSDPTVTSAIDERADARLYTIKMRIRPTAVAEPGACLLMDAGDLRVGLRGQRVDADRVELTREPERTIHALVIDTSRSMAGDLDYVRDSASRYVDRLNPDRDRAMIVSFDDSVLLQQRPTNDRARLREAIDRLRTGSGTALDDALHQVIRELSVQRERPVLILLSDGVDSASIHERDDVLRLLDRRPDLTIFTIGFNLPPLLRAGPSGMISIRRYLQNLASKTNGRFFDVPTGSTLEGVYRRIHEMLQSEVVVRVTDPEPTIDAGKVKLGSLRTGCRLEVFKTRQAGDDPLTQPILRPWPAPGGTFELPPDERYLRTAVFRAFHVSDPICEETDRRTGKTKDRWQAESADGAIRGCALDVAMDSGVLYDPFSLGTPNLHCTWNGFLRTRTRTFSLSVPRLKDLPEGADVLIERLGDLLTRFADDDVERDSLKKPYDLHARPYHDLPMLVNGRTFFDLRERLAIELFLHPEYREWVLTRLTDESRLELERLRERYHERAPGASPSSIDLAVELSDEGRRLRERAGNPSALDLSRHLTAWLGDIPAHRLMSNLESGGIDDLIAGRADSLAAFEQRWPALRQVIFAPSYARELTLLMLARDPDEARLGLYRIVLPRPSWFQPRLRHYENHPGWSDLPFDLVPDRPAALEAIRVLLTDHPEIAQHLRREGYAVSDLRYASRLKPRHQTPAKAFSQMRVSILLRAGERRLSLELDLTVPKGAEKRPSVVAVRASAESDPALEVMWVETGLDTTLISDRGR